MSKISFTDYNISVIRKRLKLAEKNGLTDMAAYAILRNTAHSIMAWMQDKSYTYEDRTYNLSGSVGCAIYKDGVIVDIIGPEIDPINRKVFTYLGTKQSIDGMELFNTIVMESNPDISLMGKYVLGVYVAAPYGKWVDEGSGTQRADGAAKRGTGWFSGPEGLRAFAVSEFNRLKNEYFASK